MRISKHCDISMGHRLHLHSGKCSKLHGHNYRITLYVDGDTNEHGMVMDFSDFNDVFSDLKSKWDHRMLIFKEDPIANELQEVCNKYTSIGSVFIVDFIPTAENIAQHILDTYALPTAVMVQETDKCVALAERRVAHLREVE